MHVCKPCHPVARQVESTSLMDFLECSASTPTVPPSFVALPAALHSAVRSPSAPETPGKTASMPLFFECTIRRGNFDATCNNSRCVCQIVQVFPLTTLGGGLSFVIILDFGFSTFYLGIRAASCIAPGSCCCKWRRRWTYRTASLVFVPSHSFFGV